ncbi:MAG: hypothetical protein PHQ85_05405 [Eubacteriales bacterium]|jgi:hypothetical protein|nr:hypothetical protein [Eubacteriales bacterium]MDD4104654.1 hypothetical protein [Eubacteriales bacterium]MDD4710808.1 hypothetical protein [Eubacteriales bacterium]NLO14405.1 hypothetical protein [Clostridiales bacterium]
MNTQETITKVVNALKGNDELTRDFKKNPKKVLENLLKIDLPDEKLDEIVEGVKAKLDLEKLGEGGLLKKAKKLFGGRK